MNPALQNEKSNNLILIMFYLCKDKCQMTMSSGGPRHVKQMSNHHVIIYIINISYSFNAMHCISHKSACTIDLLWMHGAIYTYSVFKSFPHSQSLHLGNQISM